MTCSSGAEIDHLIRTSYMPDTDLSATHEALHGALQSQELAAENAHDVVRGMLQMSV